MDSLCGTCCAFQSWDLPRVQRWSGAKFPHHKNVSSLSRSASNGCHLCSLIFKALERCSRPEGKALPERQIWLECCEVDLFTVESTRIKIYIEPTSLATAGNRVEHVSGKTISNFTVDEVGAKDMQMMRAMLGTFCIVATPYQTRYFYEDNEIHNSDLFYALANPYYESSLEFAALPGTLNYSRSTIALLSTKADYVTKVLDACSSHPDSSTGSKSSFELIRGWNEQCKAHHSQCKRITENVPVLPTRVIDIESASQDYAGRLFVTHSSQRAPYVALSHRWGETRPLTTTIGTLDERQQGILIESVSQTFRDAITATKELGLRYLWIDSLCIIQDSSQDWVKEAANMASIYNNASFTIAAVDTEDSTAGCFSARNGLANRPCRVKIDVAKNVFPISGEIYIAQHGSCHRPRGPLDTRAWVLQEQLLSSRIINYMRGNIYWECLETEASEIRPEGLLTAREETFAHDEDFVRVFKRGIGGLLDLTVPEYRSKFHRSWQLVVQAYSRRNLTKESDRYAAILGIVTAIGRCTRDKFISGVWEDFLPFDLLWCVYGPGCPTMGSSLGLTGKLGPAGSRVREFQGKCFYPSTKCLLRLGPIYLTT